MATKPNTEHKQAKTYGIGTLIMSNLITFAFTAMILVIVGYFIGVTIHESARADVVHDMSLVSKDK